MTHNDVKQILEIGAPLLTQRLIYFYNIAKCAFFEAATVTITTTFIITITVTTVLTSL